jgi:hypothetical protein
MRIYYCLKFANCDFSSTKSKSKRKDKKYINVTQVKGLGPELKLRTLCYPMSGTTVHPYTVVKLFLQSGN